MHYEMKWIEELIWIAIVSAAVQAIMVLSGFNPEGITDWKGWAIALIAGSIRAAAGAVIAAIAARKASGN